MFRSSVILWSSEFQTVMPDSNPDCRNNLDSNLDVSGSLPTCCGFITLSESVILPRFVTAWQMLINHAYLWIWWGPWSIADLTPLTVQPLPSSRLAAATQTRVSSKPHHATQGIFTSDAIPVVSQVTRVTWLPVTLPVMVTVTRTFLMRRLQ